MWVMMGDKRAHLTWDKYRIAHWDVDNAKHEAAKVENGLSTIVGDNVQFEIPPTEVTFLTKPTY